MALDPVTAYARDVAKRKIPAGKLHRLACERHLRDLEESSTRGIHFDVDAAAKACRFFSILKHSKGVWAGTPIKLEPWQVFMVGSLFGWKREDGTRRFRTAYNELPRKNGKSTLAAGVALLLAFFSGEAGAEVYCAATKSAQAQIVFGEARRMVLKNPPMKEKLGVHKLNLFSEETGSKLEPLSADAETQDGLNIHAAIVDELHAHKTRAMVDVLETATGSRREPLIFYITTAGYDRLSVCWESHEYARQVLEGNVGDDTFFAFIAAADPGDDWKDPATWAKANPNLGVSIYEHDLARKAARAAKMPAQQNAFRRLHLNEWTEQAERWIDLEAWDECGGGLDPSELVGKRCFGGLDLGRTRDLSALELVFPPDEDRDTYEVLSFFWVPEEGMKIRVERDGVPYDVWSEQGLLKTTAGNVTDYDVIREDIKELAAKFEIVEIAYDPWSATQLATQLMDDGATMVEFRQGMQSMAGPTKELERLILAKKLRHGNNPILRTHAGNVAVTQDAAGNMKPDKAKSTERIDGIVALIMALGRAMVHGGEGGSVYEEFGLTVL